MVGFSFSCWIEEWSLLFQWIIWKIYYIKVIHYCFFDEYFFCWGCFTSLQFLSCFDYFCLKTRTLLLPSGLVVVESFQIVFSCCYFMVLISCSLFSVCDRSLQLLVSCSLCWFHLMGYSGLRWKQLLTW